MRSFITERRVFGVLRWASIVFFVIISGFPLLYMVALSFKPIQELLSDPGQWWPTVEQVVALDTYEVALAPVEDGGFGFLTFVRNSAFVSLATVTLTLGVGTLSAYAAARLDFFGRRAIGFGIVMIYLFPVVVIAVPLFVMFSRIGLRSSVLPLIVVYLATTLPVALYMLRNYFEGIPEDLEEAAMIDGLSRLGVIRRVTLPLAAPAVAAVALYVFMIAWNEFLYANLFLAEQRDSWTLSLGVQQLDSQEVPKTVLMAGSVIISVPVIVLFLAAERFMTEGLTAGGVKG